jgi:hypothetical protein
LFFVKDKLLGARLQEYQKKRDQKLVFDIIFGKKNEDHRECGYRKGLVKKTIKKNVLPKRNSSKGE